MRFKPLALGVAICSIFVGPLMAAEIEEPKPKPFPEVTFDRVSEIFGHNLDTENPRLKTLLLAIGMDHTSPNSPHNDQQVGIPFIVHFGPSHWVNRLSSGDTSIEVLMNNALLLLFAEADIPNREKAAYDLVQIAAEDGYWPADYFVAETNLIKHLVRDPDNLVPLTNVIERSNLGQIAKDTMAAYNRCAEIGFAPCRYRIGFWLANSIPTHEDGLRILQSAVDTTLKDTRYAGVLDDELTTAASELALKGDVIGLGLDMRQHYHRLVSEYLSH